MDYELKLRNLMAPGYSGQIQVWTFAELMAEAGDHRREYEQALERLLEEGLVLKVPGIDGLYWQAVSSRHERPPYPGLIARASARQLGRRWAASVREAEGELGIQEKYHDYVPNPGLVAMEGVQGVEEYGDRDGRPVVVAEEAPTWVFDLHGEGEHRFAQFIAQAFRNHLSDARLDQLVRGAAWRLAVPHLRRALVWSIGRLPVEFHDVGTALLARFDEHIRTGSRLPTEQAPEDWEPPEDFRGPVLFGKWKVRRDEWDGVAVEYLTGGRMRGHPYLLVPSPLWTSSALEWIDRERGWARSASRLYKLEGQGGELADDEEC